MQSTFYYLATHNEDKSHTENHRRITVLNRPPSPMEPRPYDRKEKKKASTHNHTNEVNLHREDHKHRAPYTAPHKPQTTINKHKTLRARHHHHRLTATATRHQDPQTQSPGNHKTLKNTIHDQQTKTKYRARGRTITTSHTPSGP